MKLGICLTGGGAKGAFEAGALKRIYEEGIEPEVITGTSVGAVNGYHVMKGCLEELYEFWLKMDSEKFKGKVDLVIDNSAMIDELRKLEGRNQKVRSLYVNYVAIENRKLTEKIENIIVIEKEEALSAVKYSSLLPYREEKEDNSKVKLKFDSSRVFENFRNDVKMGIYDGFKLDGGILNNSLLSPFTQERVDKILIIALKNNYIVPEFIYNYYNKQSIFTMEPDLAISPEDTLRFDRDYCRCMFERGYRLAEDILKVLK